MSDNVTLQTFAGSIGAGKKIRVPVAEARSISFKAIDGVSVSFYNREEMVQAQSEPWDGLSVSFRSSFNLVEIENKGEAEKEYRFSVSGGTLSFFNRGGVIPPPPPPPQPYSFGYIEAMAELIGFNRIINTGVIFVNAGDILTFDGDFFVFIPTPTVTMFHNNNTFMFVHGGNSVTDHSIEIRDNGEWGTGNIMFGWNGVFKLNGAIIE